MRISVSESAVIRAPAAAVYEIIADYEDGHPSILPERYLSGLVVEEGGRGEGTTIRFSLHLPGQTREVVADVKEPEPGRRIEEIDRKTGAVTSFTIDDSNGASTCRVTIETAWNRPVLIGWIERILAPALLKKMYREELEKLARRAATSDVG